MSRKVRLLRGRKLQLCADPLDLIEGNGFFQGGDLHGDIPCCGGFARSTHDFNPRQQFRQSIQRLILHAATHNADAVDGLAGESPQFTHYRCVPARETAEDDRGQFRRPPLLREARGAQPGVDTFHHVAGSKIRGFIRMEVWPLGGSLHALRGQFCRCQALTLAVPFAQTLLQQPQADDVLEEPDAARHATFVGEFLPLRPHEPPD